MDPASGSLRTWQRARILLCNVHAETHCAYDGHGRGPRTATVASFFLGERHARSTSRGGSSRSIQTTYTPNKRHTQPCVGTQCPSRRCDDPNGSLEPQRADRTAEQRRCGRQSPRVTRLRQSGIACAPIGCATGCACPWTISPASTPSSRNPSNRTFRSTMPMPTGAG